MTPHLWTLPAHCLLHQRQHTQCPENIVSTGSLPVLATLLARMFFNLFYLGLQVLSSEFFPEFHSFTPEFPKHHHGRSRALCPATVATRLFFRLRLPLFLELRKVSYKVFHWGLFWAQPGSGTRPSLMHVTTSEDFWKSINYKPVAQLDGS